MAERMLNLIPTDVGRPIGHIKPNIDCPDLEELIREADRHASSAVEREVQDRQGTGTSLRIRPYKNVDNRIDGAVLSLFDIDALHRQEVELREMRHYAEAVVRGGRAAARRPRRRAARPDGEPGVSRGRSGLAIRRQSVAVRSTISRTVHGDGDDSPARARRASTPASAEDRVVLRHVSPREGGRPMRVDARRIDGPAGRPSADPARPSQETAPGRTMRKPDDGTLAARRRPRRRSRTWKPALARAGSRGRAAGDVQRARVRAAARAGEPRGGAPGDSRASASGTASSSTSLRSATCRSTDTGIIHSVNLAAARLLGRERAQLLGMPLLGRVAGDDRRRLLEHLRRCRTTFELVTLDLELPRRGGGTMPVAAR